MGLERLLKGNPSSINALLNDPVRVRAIEEILKKYPGHQILVEGFDEEKAYLLVLLQGEGEFYFTCKREGKCCYFDSPFLVTIEDIRRLGEKCGERVLREVLTLFLFGPRCGITLKRRPEGSCVFFDPRSNLCKIYDVRPINCRLRPVIFSGEGIGLDASCPGILNGEKWTIRSFLRDQGIGLSPEEIRKEFMRSLEITTAEVLKGVVYRRGVGGIISQIYHAIREN